MSAPFQSPEPDTALAMPWLTDMRGRARDNYGKLGLPSPRVEDWRYTRLSHLTDDAFDSADTAPPLSIDDLRAVVPNLGAAQAVLVNGVFRPELSTVGALPDGVQVASLGQVLTDAPDLIRLHLGRLATLPNRPLTSLNTAHLGDGLVVHLEAGVALEEPLHLVSLGVSPGQAVVFHPRILVVLEEGAAATLIEHHLGVGDSAYFSNAVTELDIAGGARLRHIKLQDEPLAATHLAGAHVSLGEAAAYDGFVFQCGGKVARHEVHAYLGSGRSDLRLAGVYLADGQQTIDNTTRVRHAAAGCRSRQAFKGVLRGAARGVFQGGVLVERDAQQTDAHQMSRALLLSDRAEVDAKPELEIYADDVKCSHGVTAGELDEAALFYLLSRGLPPSTARLLLVEGFLSELIEPISVPAVRDLVGARIAAWLGRPEMPQ